MTARMIDQLGNVEKMSDTAFYERIFGHPLLTKEQRLAQWQAEIERYADMIERGQDWAVPPPCLHDARLLVAGRARGRAA